MKLPQITNPTELAALVNEIGFLPFFRCGIPGFSLEECTPAGYWFVDGVDGPWEWKKTIADQGEIAYAKLFNKKAGYVSRNWYPTLANYRRDGYDFDARYDEGLASRKCKHLMDLLADKGPLLSSDLKKMAGYQGGGEHGFETVITLLQMQTYITVKTFDYRLDKLGRPYGWGIARYIITEDAYGADFVTSAYREKPAASKAKMISHLQSLFAEASEKQIETLIRWR